jgi:hypothetical protein
MTDGGPGLPSYGLEGVGDAAQLVFAFRRDTTKPAIVYRVVGSGDLTTWTPVPDQVRETRGTIEIREIRVNVNQPGGMRFFQPHVSRQQ